MRIGTKSASPFVGDNVYSPTGAGEAKTISVAHHHSGTFYVDLQNDGLQGGLWWIQGPAGSNGFTVVLRWRDERDDSGRGRGPPDFAGTRRPITG